VDGGLFNVLSRYDFVLWDIQGIYYVVPLVCATIYLAFFLLFRKSTIGLRLVASEENPELAMVQGVNPWRLKLLAWSISGGIACVAGSLFPPFIHLEPAAALVLLSPILAAGVISGFELLAFAVIADFAVGSTEILATFWLMANVGGWTGNYRPLIPIALLYFSMLPLPRGLVTLKEFLIEVYTSRKI
jgi:branched-chain amino acid transport system permease protein